LKPFVRFIARHACLGFRTPTMPHVFNCLSALISILFKAVNRRWFRRLLAFLSKPFRRSNQPDDSTKPDQDLEQHPNPTISDYTIASIGANPNDARNQNQLAGQTSTQHTHRSAGNPTTTTSRPRPQRTARLCVPSLGLPSHSQASTSTSEAETASSSAFSGWSEGTSDTAATTPGPGTPVPLPRLQTETVTRPSKRKALLIGITYATRQAADAAAAAAAKVKRDGKSPVTPHQALTGPHVDCQAMKKILMGERRSGEPILSKADGMVAS
jgi:hypothetical protein